MECRNDGEYSSLYTFGPLYTGNDYAFYQYSIQEDMYEYTVVCDWACDKGIMAVFELILTCVKHGELTWRQSLAANSPTCLLIDPQICHNKHVT